jgi:hypothetical protein
MKLLDRFLREINAPKVTILKVCDLCKDRQAADGHVRVSDIKDFQRRHLSQWHQIVILKKTRS